VVVAVIIIIVCCRKRRLKSEKDGRKILKKDDRDSLKESLKVINGIVA